MVGWARRAITRGGVVALSAIVVASALGADPSAASTWESRQLRGEAAESMLFGVSCPSAQFCVAVGRNNTVATSTDPTGDASSWNSTFVGSGSFETGLGGGFYNGAQIRGVSCPTTQLCVAVSFEGFIYTSTNPTGGASAWTVTDLAPTGPNPHFYGISCPSSNFCAAAASSGKIVTSTNPTGGAGAWSTTQLEGPLELRGISCVSAAFCVAVGDNGAGIMPQSTDVGQILSSTDPLGGNWQRVAMTNGQGSLYGVSCPSPALCATGNLYGNLLVATSPTGSAEAWKPAPGGGPIQITDVDCPSVTQCVAVNNNADVMTSANPPAGGWSFTNLRPFAGVEETSLLNGTFGVSCPTASFCAVVGALGTIYTSENAFAVTPSTTTTGGGKKAAKTAKGKKRPKRPRVSIARAPFPTEIEGKRTKVRLRAFFFAPQHVQVRGFSCKIDNRPAKRCRSPKVFTVGLGKHAFRVWAIGWTGLKGKMAFAKFEVCHPRSRGIDCRGKPLDSANL
jgi:hypothetical protein